MKLEPEETNRCWALLYAENDGLRFHIDILPSLPEEEAVKAALREHRSRGARTLRDRLHRPPTPEPLRAQPRVADEQPGGLRPVVRGPDA